MRPINPRGKTFSFLLGLIYGYRTADIDLKIFSMKEFRREELEGFILYYLDRKGDRVSKGKPLENPSHIVALKEDRTLGKVRVYIYKA
jgi:hypothetical protein